MSKITLILDASQLTEAQNCPKADFYSRVKNLEPKKSNLALSKGGFFHEVMKLYYTMKRDGVVFSEIKEVMLNFWNEKQSELAAISGIETSDLLLIMRRLLEYIVYDYNNRRDWKIIAIEQGFSAKLYEDTAFLYIYEGRIDLLVEVQGKRCVTDHKTQAMKYDWPFYSNQMLGYCFATNSRYAMYNYIGLQENVGDNTFRAQLEHFNEDQIERWRQDTIAAYDEIVYNTLFNRYNRRRSGCINRFGLCRFYDVCKMTTQEGEEQKLNDLFKERKKPWRAWE